MLVRRFFLFAGIFLVIQSSSFSQLLNGDFESWRDSLEYNQNNADIADSAIQVIPLDWESDYGNSSNGEIGFYQTTDAVSGNYAVVLSTWYVYEQTILSQEGTLSSRPSALTGMYKYLIQDDLLDSTDVATASIEIFNAQGDIIGSALRYLDTLSNYTPFSIPIEYQNEDLATSYKIHFKSSEGTCSSFTGQCKFLFLDDLKFEEMTSTESIKSESKIVAYPNPTLGEVKFSKLFKTCEVYDFQGQLIYRYEKSDLISLPDKTGLYLLRFEDLDGIISNHKILKRM